MLYLTASPGDKLVLGRAGEHLARTVRIDIARWRAMYGEGIAALLLRRPGEADPYPCAITQDDDLVTWPITMVETAIPGTTGRYELQYRVGDQLVKSATGIAVVHDALSEPTEEPPEAQQGWVDQVLSAGAAAQTAATDAGQSASDAATSAGHAADSAAASAASAENAAGSASRAEAAAGQIPTVDPDTDHWVIGGEDTGVPATGPKGDAATIQIVDTRTVGPEAPATLTETEGSTPQDRRYIASIPKGDPGKDGVVDKALGLTNAAVGDIIKVKAVDDEGRPTEWEAEEVDLYEWVNLGEYNVADMVFPAYITLDDYTYGELSIKFESLIAEADTELYISIKFFGDGENETGYGGYFGQTLPVGTHSWGRRAVFTLRAMDVPNEVSAENASAMATRLMATWVDAGVVIWGQQYATGDRTYHSRYYKHIKAVLTTKDGAVFTGGRIVLYGRKRR